MKLAFAIRGVHCATLLAAAFAILCEHHAAAHVTRLQCSPVEGELRVQLSHQHPGGAAFNLEVSNGSIFALSFSTKQISSSAGLVTGARLQVSGTVQLLQGRSLPAVGRRLAGAALQLSLDVSEYTVLSDAAPAAPGPATSLPGASGSGVAAAMQRPQAKQQQPHKLNVLFVILQVCSQPAAITVKDLSFVLFSNSTSSLKQLYRSCSYGAVGLDSSSARVVGPVLLACSGAAKAPFPAYTWTASSGSTSWDLYGVSYSALNYIQDHKLADLARFKRIALILPTSTPFPIYSLGEWGCGGRFCFSWFSPGASRDPTAFAHELSHSFGLSHAARGGDDIGDDSCIMGYCGEHRCFNHPHMWQLGWASPVADLGAAALPAGRSRAFTIPAAHLVRRNMLRVTAGWNPYQGDVYFVGYRAKGGFAYDRDLRWGYAGKVNVYMYRGGQGQGRTRVLTQHLAALRAGERWEAGAGGLWMTVAAVSGGKAATVVLCRFRPAARETDCGDGVDNDCDGLVDDRDPDCPGYARAAAARVARAARVAGAKAAAGAVAKASEKKPPAKGPIKKLAVKGPLGK